MVRLRSIGVGAIVALAIISCGADSDQADLADDPTSDIVERAGIEVEDDTGTVVIDDVSYTLTNALCFPARSSFVVEGPATSTGEFGDAWVSISVAQTEDHDGDGEADVTADLTIEHGKTDALGEAGEALPDFYATRYSFSSQPDTITEDVFLFQIDDSTVSGSGEIYDGNGVAIPFGETQPFTFEATC